MSWHYAQKICFVLCTLLLSGCCACISRSLSWIPTKILHCYYRPSAEDMLCVERCLLSCLVPVNLKPEERMERMVNVYSTLEDENANKYSHYLYFYGGV